MKTSEIEDEAAPVRLRPQPIESVSINIPVDTLESIRQIAARRDMSEAALLRLYIGHGLRQDLSRVYSERVKEKTASVLGRYIQSQEEIANILREIQTEAVR